MKHILVVDDNKVNLVAAKNFLSGTYKVTAVTMGAQALKFLENNKVDLILLDKNMPEMDGFEVMEKLKEKNNTRDIPVVFLTAENDSGVEAKCIRAGAFDFIAKPFVPEVMLSRIAKVLELEELKNNLARELDEKTREVTTIKSKSQQDALTGLWNRAYTEEKVNEMLEEGIAGSLFMIDMDNFKAINDNYGHIAGDETLKMFADTLRNHCCSDDIICRIGGDEFVVFLKEKTGKPELSNLASDIISDLAGRLKELKIETNSSVSIGISQAPNDGTEFNKLYNAADKSLYYVKQNGKNSFHFYSERNINATQRASQLIDLAYIRDFMSRQDPSKGAYLLDFDNFRHVYNFVRRVVERSHTKVQTLLFTLSVKPGYMEKTDEMELALDLLDQAIFSSLRRMDVSTRYSSRQVIVMLVDTKTENADLVAGRIINAFFHFYLGTSIEIDYEKVEMDSTDK
ncbi:MAG: diguanylate cyclase [Clostridiales bacterium]|nr:diguanylate cyclase [Clostridiales bacterium]